MFTLSAMVQDNFLIVADSGTDALFQVDLLKGTAWKIPVSRQKAPTALDYDPVELKIYWTDVRDKVIKRSNLDGTNEQVIKSLHRRKYLNGTR